MVSLQPLFLTLKQALLRQDSSIDLYVFGSALHDKLPNDIDILVIYKNPGELLAIKNEFFQIGLEYPLDIYYMTPEEVRELDFINVTEAMALAVLVDSSNCCENFINSAL